MKMNIKNIKIGLVVVALVVIISVAYFSLNKTETPTNVPDNNSNEIDVSNDISRVTENEVLALEDIILGAGGEVTLSFTTTTEKWNTFKVGFLKMEPVPLLEDGSPMMTEGQWVKKFTKGQLMRFYRAGMKQIHKEAQDPIVEDIFD